MITFKQFLREASMDVAVVLALTQMLRITKPEAKELARWLLDGDTSAELPVWEVLERHYDTELQGHMVMEYGPTVAPLLKKDLKERYGIELPNL